MNFKKLTCLASLVMLMTTLAKAADVKVKIVNDERFQRQIHGMHHGRFPILYHLCE